MAKMFHVLNRGAGGGLTTATRAYLKTEGVKLDVKSSRVSGDAAEVLREFQDVLPKSIRIPEESPFVILRTVSRPGGGTVAECQCKCGVQGDCGGGGGGGSSR